MGLGEERRPTSTKGKPTLAKGKPTKMGGIRPFLREVAQNLGGFWAGGFRPFPSLPIYHLLSIIIKKPVSFLASFLAFSRKKQLKKTKTFRRKTRVLFAAFRHVLHHSIGMAR